MLRIGALARLAGVSPDLIRTWEKRYGLFEPERSPSGLRLYTELDEARALAMVDGLRRGLSAREAARAARERPLPEEGRPLEALVVRLREALDRFDDGAAHRELDRLFATFSVETALSEVVLPYLHELGERWVQREVTVGQEHFASNLLAGRLHVLARSWDEPAARRALLACPSGEQHTLGLLCFGVALRARGWRVTFLGADTPLATLRGAAEHLEPELVVVSSVRPEPLRDAATDLERIAEHTPVAAGGAGAARARLTARLLEGDPVEAAASVA